MLSGPFKGVRYLDGTVWGSITPKWLGSYESELNHVIEEIVAKDYNVILNVGCAEGYYAVGLAYRLPGARILAYDTDFLSRRQTRRLARLNRCEMRVSVRRYCACSDIEKHATDKTLIVCDIEGFERSLLDPALCPSLRRIDMLVEVHEENWSPRTLALLKTRFSDSHSLEEISGTDRQKWIESFVGTLDLPMSNNDLREATEEHRYTRQTWLWMKSMLAETSSQNSAVSQLSGVP